MWYAGSDDTKQTLETPYIEKKKKKPSSASRITTKNRQSFFCPPVVMNPSLRQFFFFLGLTHFVCLFLFTYVCMYGPVLNTVLCKYIEMVMVSVSYVATTAILLLMCFATDCHYYYAAADDHRILYVFYSPTRVEPSSSRSYIYAEFFWRWAQNFYLLCTVDIISFFFKNKNSPSKIVKLMYRVILDKLWKKVNFFRFHLFIVNTSRV